MKHYDYIDLRYKPKAEDLVVEYRIEPNGVSLKEACGHVAAESSIGTWTKISTLNKRIAKKLKPHVFSINPKTKEVKIAYPAELFEAGNMPQIYSSIAGNVFGMKIVKGLRLQDISFPKSIIESFLGPKFGIKGVRKILGVKKRPLVGTIVKPKVGLNERQHAKVAYEAWVGGLDIVKDDENLSSMKFNNFKKRIDLTLKMRKKAEKETREKKIYMPNVTAETSEMLRRAKYVKKKGGRYVMIDIITCGWSALQTLRQADLGLVIHAHRAMHGAFTENFEHGISMLVIAKTARLIGVDQIHVGAIVGKMKGGRQEVIAIGQEIESKIVNPSEKDHVLAQKWYNIKPIFAVCSGGLHPGKIPLLVEAMGNDIIIQAGGGVHWHPDGTRYGARALRQAINGYMEGIPLDKYATIHGELKQALKEFGLSK